MSLNDYDKNTVKSLQAINKSIASFAVSDSMQRILDNYSHINKSIARFAVSDSMQQILDNYSHINKSIARFAVSDSMRQILDNYSAINKSLTRFATSDSLIKILDSIHAENSLTESLASISTSETLADYLKAGHLEFDLENYQISDTEESDLNQLENSVNSSEFLANFEKLSPYLQIILLYFLMEILLPILLNVASNLITPYVEDVIGISGKQTKEQIKVISNIKIDDVDLDRYRFVTANNLILRERAKSKSAALDNLQFGQVITVISRDKNWLEVTYTYDNKNIMHGWVFARYTAKFKH